jgi:hypothetical protein
MGTVVAKSRGMRSLAHASLLGLLVLAMTPACGDDEEETFSNSFDTTEMNASLGAFADEGRLRVYAAVLGPKGFLRLRGGDTFEIEIDGQRVATNERVLNDKIHYIADVPVPPAETTVTVTFVRGVERTVGKIRLYSAFTVKAPPATMKKNALTEIDIDPRPDLSKWPGFFGPGLNAKAEVNGDCIEGGSQQIDLCAANSEPGKCTQGYPLQLDTKKLRTTGNCKVAVQVRLTSGASPFEGTGPEKKSFKGGGFEGYRLRSFETQLVD